jgi:outer membrane protein assembly factor BamB
MIYKLFFILIGLFFCTSKSDMTSKTVKKKSVSVVLSNQKTPQLQLLWSTDSVFKTPESVVYDEKRAVIYVSNMNLNPRQKDGNGFISKVAKNGKIIQLEWVSGMSSPKGLALFGNTLYTADVDEVIAMNVETGKIIKKYPFPQAIMLNDVSVDKDGTVFVTDMDAGKIYTIKKEIIEVWKSDLNKPNGIFVENDRVLTVSSGDGAFLAHDIKSKTTTTIANGMGKGDGIEKTKAGDYLVSDWNGELFLIRKGVATAVLSTKKENIQIADIGIIKKENIVLVPTFFNNKLVAYQL